MKDSVVIFGGAETTGLGYVWKFAIATRSKHDRGAGPSKYMVGFYYLTPQAGSCEPCTVRAERLVDPSGWVPDKARWPNTK